MAGDHSEGDKDVRSERTVRPGRDLLWICMTCKDHVKTIVHTVRGWFCLDCAALDGVMHRMILRRVFDAQGNCTLHLECGHSVWIGLSPTPSSLTKECSDCLHQFIESKQRGEHRATA